MTTHRVVEGPIMRTIRAATFLALCLLLAGCGKSKVTQQNFEKIKEGMTLQEVEAILGPGQKDENVDASNVAAQFGVNVGGQEQRGKNLSTYVWESRGKTIKVHFLNDKVARKEKEGL
jgi:hypothetical protein